jgi:LPXTG-site transpeptidase (sortase) family protein
MKLYLKAPVKNQLARPSFRWLPAVLVGAGTLVVAWVTLPIVTYELISGPRLKATGWASPQVKGAEPDYTQVSSWFPAAPPQETKVSKITHYTLDIPKLKIKNAVVTIGGEDLKQSLIQYGGTANPGEPGVPVIFGHSILRQFYNPSETNPQRYMSIFSTMMTLEAGDEIYVDYDGIKYKYVVRKKYQVEPADIDILAQRYDQKLLRLITCVPEGTYLHRGVVEAVLEPI